MTDTATAPAWAAARIIRAENQSETQTQLLESAAAVFARRGYARTTVEDITTAAQVSRPTFYSYFASKAEIFAKVAGRVRDEFLAAHELPRGDESDLYNFTRTTCAAFLAAYAANASLLTVIEEQASSSPVIAEISDEIRQRPRRRVARWVQQLIDERDADPAAPPGTTAEALMGIIAGCGRFAPADAAAFNDLIDAVTAMVLRLIGIEATTR